jgi:hypothetical protein
LEQGLLDETILPALKSLYRTQQEGSKTDELSILSFVTAEVHLFACFSHMNDESGKESSSLL